MSDEKSLLMEALLELDETRKKIKALTYNEPVAIIGMSCRFPGGANDPETFWKLLEQGFDSSIEIPKNRWDVDKYYDSNPDAPGKIISRKSSFLTIPIEQFDAGFFNISPREAEYLDPQQRLLLEVSVEALVNANIDPWQLRGSQTGVFIGISSHDYGELLGSHFSEKDIEAYFGTGNSSSTATGRISYTLGLQGPSIAIDTACSSSLVALHEACQSLRNGESTMAIAGGVNLILTPFLSINFSQAHMLSADGHCKTFDASADGYVRGEGCGIIILKRLSDAKRDNDPILAVIKGSAVNQDGASGGLTVPNGPAQEAVIKRALEQAKLNPQDINYIETHGTGTSLGDPIEVNAISHVFGKERQAPLTIGTVKTNIGHLEAAAGIAGVIKTILSLQNETIPKHLHFKTINPSIHLEAIPAQIPLDPISWKKGDKPRRAGISSFGFSGTNAHIIVEEAPQLDISKQRQSLPKLEFHCERYWPAALTHTKITNALAIEVHPLLGVQLPDLANQNMHVFEQMIRLSNDSFSYLKDHQVFNRIIFPGAGYVELMLSAIKLSNLSEQGIEIDKISVQLPLRLDLKQDVELQSLVTTDEKGLQHISIYSKAIADIDSGWQLHAQAEGKLLPALSIVHPVSLAELKASCQKAIDTKVFYEQLAAQGLHYGPTFQTVKELYKGNDVLLAKVVLNETTDTRYQLHPALFDGALQGLACLFNAEGSQQNIVYLPVGFEHISLYQGGTTECYVHAEIASKTDEILKANLTLLNEAGDVLAKVEGFEAKRVSKSTLEKLINTQDSVAKWCYESIWKSYELIENEAQSNRTLVNYDAREKNKNVIGTQGVEQLLIFIQDLIKKQEDLYLTIVTEQAYSLTSLHRHPRESGDPSDASYRMDPRFREDDGVGGPMRDSLDGFAQVEINLTQAMLNGFIKTAAVEYPSLHIRQVDVTKDQDIEPLLAQLEKDNSRESIFAYRDNQWYVARIVEESKANHEQERLSIPTHDYQLVKNVDSMLSSLSLIETEVLFPKDNEIMIESRAVGLNFRDVLNAMNLYPGDPGPLGGDCSGIVKAVGKNITEYKVGDEVLGLAMSALSSQAVTFSHLITKKPSALTFEEASAIPTVFMTAYLALVKLAKLQAGQTVLIHAGSGGVGLAAIQIAQYCKAKIITTAGSDIKRDYLHKLGVEDVLDSRSISYQAEISRITNGKGVDVVLNSLTGPGFIEASLDSMAKRGRFVEIGKRDIWTAEQIHNKREDVIYHILALDQLAVEKPEDVGGLLQEVMELFEAKLLTPIPQKVFSLTETISAFKYLQQAKQIGKVVITLPSPQLKFSSQGCYLITGGLGGLGLSLMSYLSEHGAKHLILAARNKPSETANVLIEQVRSQGVEVIVESCDVSNREQVHQLIKKSHRKEHPLKGIFHTAGSIDDAPIDKQTPERLEKVFAAKAQGAWHLHEITQSEKITFDYFVLFSSVASLLGSAAQSNYACANSFLDGLAQYRQQQGLVAQSINWGPWGQVGMATNLATTHQRQGLVPFKTEQGLQALDYALHQATAQLGIMHINWKKMGEQTTRIPSWLDSLLQQKEESALIKQLQAVPQEDREILLKAAILQEVRKVLGLSSVQSLNEQQGFFEMGMDSLMALELKNRLQTLLGKSLSNTLAFDYPTLDQLVPYLAQQLNLSQLPQKVTPIAQYINPAEPIAIIGIGCRLPGGANDPETFWQLLEQGFDSSIEVPKNRWDIDEYYDSNPDAPGKMISRKSSFLTTPVENFDAAFFGISPREAEYLDPQQRLLLEVTWEAIENARIQPSELRGTQTGVFVGICSNDYGDLLAQYSTDKDIEAYFGTGNAASTATGRISYTLGLQGPSIATDTACSSSLVAVHQACQSLRNGESNLAITGGVNLILSPALNINFSKAHMLSADGYCKTFDAAADGYVRGEGCGIIILKRLSDAERDKDPILAVIKGSAVNQDGASSGLTVPNGPAQEAVIKRALAQAKLTPDEIDYIEAHGTGTSLGDPIEINAIANVFSDNRQTPLTIGTVKTNIGHLEGAAGIAGLIKTILSLQHETIPRHLHFQEINPSINLAAIPAQIPLQPTEWKKTNHSRRAGISSFGFSGTNAHVIIEEAPEQAIVEQRQALPKTEFHRERYWPEILTHKKTNNSFGMEVHPLLGVKLPAIANQNNTIFEQTIKTSGEAFSYLADHQIFKQEIFPGTAYIEMMLSAVKLIENTEQGIELDGVSIQLPLRLDKKHSSKLQSIVTIDEKGSQQIAIYSRDITEDGNEWQLHAQGTGKLLPVLSVVNRRSLAELKSLCHEIIDATLFYEQLAVQGLHYGSAFQTVEELYKGHKALLAKIALNETADDGRYQLHPALLDGALQGLACLFDAEGGQQNIIYLPVGFERISLYQGGIAACYVHAEIASKTDEILRANLTLLNEVGDVLAKVEGFEAKRVSKSTLEKLISTQDSVRKWCYEPIWQDYELVENEAKTNRTLVNYDARNVDKNAIDTQGVDQLLIFIQDLIKKQEEDHYLTIITEQAYSLTSLHRPPRESGDSSDASYRIDPRFREDDGVGGPMRDSMGSFAQDEINLTQAMLSGFIKTAALEYPSLHIRQLDVTKDQDIEPLLVQLEKDNSRESIFAYRHNQWHVARIIEESKANHEQERLSIPTHDYQLVKNSDGMLSSLSLVETEALFPKDNEIVIEPRAVGLNFRDVLNAMNLYPGDPGPLGGDCSGVVKAVGKNIKDYHVGDDVLGLVMSGLSSQALTSTHLIAKKPTALTFEQAAAIPTVFMTAYLVLVKLAKLQAGEIVLIHAGSGGVGLAAIQIANYCKAKIITTAGSDIKRDYLHKLGIEHVLDSRSTSYQAEIARMTNGKGVDVVLNSLTGPGFIEASLDSLAKNGRFVEIGKRDIWTAEQVRNKRVDITYHILALDQMAADEPQNVSRLLQEVIELFEAQLLRPIPEKVFPLTEAISAFKYLQQAKQIGKVIIKLPSPQLKFSSQGCYLITGGLGGIGLSLMSYLGEHGAKHIILASRSQPNDVATKLIEQVRAHGIEVIIERCDVSHKEQVHQLIKKSHRKDYPLKGIFHTAGSIDDAPMDKQTAERLEKVFAAKAQGACYLHEITQSEKITLDYFVLFSSIASLIGSAAQSNYACANSFLDGLAQYRQQHGLVAQSINWGPWGQVGMATNLATTHQRQGLMPFKTDKGLQALDYALHQSIPQLGIMHIDWKKMREQSAQVPSWLDSLLEQREESVLIKQLQVISQEQREILLKTAITQEVRKVLGLSSKQNLNQQQNFVEMGMDSLMVLDLRVRLQKLLSTTIDNVTILNVPTVNELTCFLLNKLSFSKAKINAGIVEEKAYNPLKMFSSTGKNSPLFCVHGIDGSQLIFTSLSKRLNIDRPIYAFQGLETLITHVPQIDTIEQRAAFYIAFLKEVQPKGPYHLLGWSLGGSIAFEMARQLIAANEKVEFLGMLDGVYSAETNPEADISFLHATRFYMEARGAALDDVILERFAKFSETTICNMVHDILEFPADMPTDDIKKEIEIIRLNGKALLHYKPQQIDQEIAFFVPEQQLNKNDFVGFGEKWQSLTSKEIKWCSVNGNHFTMLDEKNNAKLAKNLNSLLTSKDE